MFDCILESNWFWKLLDFIEIVECGMVKVALWLAGIILFALGVSVVMLFIGTLLGLILAVGRI